jgi:hypothetical protein
LLTLLALLFGITVSGPIPLTTQQIPLEQWQVLEGDRFVADTKENQGYLIHESGNYTTFPIGSGKRQRVQYLGMNYNAATPSRFWVVKSTDIFGDRATFGKTGLFLRLYEQGTTKTFYGIHSVGNIDKLLDGENRYHSMGCVLVSDEVLEIIRQTYELNGFELEVATINGMESQMLAINR